MRIHAYPATYLGSAQRALGEALDYVVQDCHMDGAAFLSMFASCPVGSQMQNGDPAYVVGRSGIEIAREVMNDMAGRNTVAEPGVHFGRSAEYWVGWALAYYQWFSGRSYREILEAAPFAELREMYTTLHEADISKFADVMDARMREHYSKTNLRRIRTAYGCSQSELAERSGVGLRSIQMYEQRNKDINKASADTLYRLSIALGCTMEDLIER